METITYSTGNEFEDQTESTENFPATFMSRAVTTYNNEVYTTTEMTLTGLTTSQIINCCAGVVMTLFTLLGQIMVFVVVSRDHRLRTPSNLFIVSLALADFLISIISMPVWTMYSTLGYWPLSQSWCDAWNVLDYVLCSASVYTITFISIDRYLSLRFVLSYGLKRTQKKAIISLASIWVGVVVVFTLFILMTQHIYGKVRDPMDCATYYLTSPVITLLLVSLVHWSCVLLTSVMYILIYQIAQKAGNVSDKKAKKETERKSNMELSSDDISVETVSTSVSLKNRSETDFKAKKTKGSKSKNDEEKERKAQRTIALLLFTFAVCWLPLSFVFAIESIKPGYLSIWWLIAGYWMGYINSMINPICYALGNPYFKETLIKLFSKSK